jgi:tripartite-type tricarboxylate transporter receptor subunit TctC
MSSKQIITAAALAGLMLGAGATVAQNYPSRPVRIITYGAGGSNDLAARLIAQGIGPSLGQPVVVDNHGSGMVPVELTAKAPPDGYTLLVGGVIFTIGHLLQDTTVDPIRDFEPISEIGISPLVLVVHPSLPANNVKELIALARSKPGVLNYGSTGVSGATHLATELFRSMVGNLNIVEINYKSGAPAINGLMSGEVGLMFVTASTVSQYIKSGRLKALAVTSAEPSQLAPGLPTVAASGVPGYESAQFSVIVAPAKTPAAIITRLNQEVVRAITQPDIKQKFLAIGVEVVASSPQQLTAQLKAEIARMGKVIKEAGIKGE